LEIKLKIRFEGLINRCDWETGELLPDRVGIGISILIGNQEYGKALMLSKELIEEIFRGKSFVVTSEADHAGKAGKLLD